MEEREMFNKSFKEWGTTYSEFSPEEVTRITNEFTLPYLDKISEVQGKKDPRVIKAIEIIKQFMKDYGYIKYRIDRRKNPLSFWGGGSSKFRQSKFSMR